MNTTLSGALLADRAASDRTRQMKLYSWLVGEWRMQAVMYADDGSIQHADGEIHCGWVLQGRALQDVWTLPGFFHGTTLRIYDPGGDVWQIIWADPLHQYYARQLGRGRGADIVQEGRNDAGDLTRWRFTEIVPDSFHWFGERSRDNGATWMLQADIRAHRRKA